jgi:hypothetical protein
MTRPNASKKHICPLDGPALKYRVGLHRESGQVATSSASGPEREPAALRHSLRNTIRARFYGIRKAAAQLRSSAG